MLERISKHSTALIRAFVCCRYISMPAQRGAYPLVHDVHSPTLHSLLTLLLLSPLSRNLSSLSRETSLVRRTHAVPRYPSPVLEQTAPNGRLWDRELQRQASTRSFEDKTRNVKFHPSKTHPSPASRAIEIHTSKMPRHSARALEPCQIRSQK